MPKGVLKARAVEVCPAASGGGHSFLLEAPNGPYSQGICRGCTIVREFVNVLPVDGGPGGGGGWRRKDGALNLNLGFNRRAAVETLGADLA